MSFPEVICPWLDEAFRGLDEAAASGRLGHGWLISGHRGIGKANLAYLLARRLLGVAGSTVAPVPATPGTIAEFYTSLETREDLHPDLHRILPEEGKTSISVERIRDVIADLGLKSHRAPSKVVIIESAEAMTTAAANALLKSLEEPTPDTFLLLLAERPGRLPATIRSRCQHLRLRPPAPYSVTEWLIRGDIDATGIPPARLAASPVAWARLLQDADKVKEINGLWRDINAIYSSSTDVHGLASRWQKGDLDLALECLTDSLRDRIRRELVPGLSNPVTDAGAGLTENGVRLVPVDVLFDGLKMAENLRDQLGRGINEELALTALLLGLRLADERRSIA